MLPYVILIYANIRPCADTTHTYTHHIRRMMVRLTNEHPVKIERYIRHIEEQIPKKNPTRKPARTYERTTKMNRIVVVGCISLISIHLFSDIWQWGMLRSFPFVLSLSLHRLLPLPICILVFWWFVDARWWMVVSLYYYYFSNSQYMCFCMDCTALYCMCALCAFFRSFYWNALSSFFVGMRVCIYCGHDHGISKCMVNSAQSHTDGQIRASK